MTPQIQERKRCIECIQKYFDGDESVVKKAIDLGQSFTHVMTFTHMRVIEAVFALIRKALTRILEYQESHQD